MTLVLLLAAARAGAQEAVRLPAASDSRLWIEGSSNVSEWSCQATRISASIDVSGASFLSPSAPVRRVEVRVPVRALHCARAAMDRDLYHALQVDDHPELADIVATLVALPGAGYAGDTVRAAGTLRVAGEEKPVALVVTTERLPDGSLLATGALPVRMTDFGVRPPTALFGWIRARDDVTVKFALHVRLPEIATAGGR